MCFLSLSNPLCSQDRPKLTQPRVPCIALAACSGAGGCHLSLFQAAPALESKLNGYHWTFLNAYVSALPSGIAREAHGLKIRPRAEGTP
jgi:hypothetical protein